MDADPTRIKKHANGLTSIRGDRADQPAAGVAPALDALGAGRVVLMVDADIDRGWFVCAADRASTEFAVRMTTYGRGVVRVAMEHDHLVRLGIPTIEAGLGLHAPVDRVGAQRSTTGDLVTTLRALADPATTADDLVVPGRVFPVAAGTCAEPGDACVARAMLEAARLAGRAPVAAYAEAVDEQGFPADRAATARLARRLGITLATLRDVLVHREHLHPTVTREVETTIPTPAGPLTAIGYRGGHTGVEYVAFVSQPLSDGMRIHVHRRCATSDVFGGVPCGCGATLNRALEEIRHSANGAVIYFEGDSDEVPFGNHADRAAMSWAATAELAGLLRDLRARRIFLSSNGPIATDDLEALGITVADVDRDWVGLPPAPRSVEL